MNRRRFLGVLAGATTAPLVAKIVPEFASSHFGKIGSPWPPEPDGMSMRLIHSFDYEGLSRMDILYGVGIIKPEYCVRVSDDDAFSDPYLDPSRLPA